MSTIKIGKVAEEIVPPMPRKKETHRTRCEVYSRVVGYLRPVDQWNKGKQQEFFQRKTFEQSDIEEK